MSVLIDTESDPGSYLDMMAHSPCLRIEDYKPHEVLGISLQSS